MALPGVRSRGPRRHAARAPTAPSSSPACASAAPRASTSPTSAASGPSARASRRSSPTRPASGSTSTPPPCPSPRAGRGRPTTPSPGFERGRRGRTPWSPRRSTGSTTRAGSLDPVEVYGTVLTQRCERCEERYGLPEAGALLGGSSDGVPRCTTPGWAIPCGPRAPSGARPCPGGRRAGLGAGRRRRRLHRPRLGPAHRADLAAALGPAHPGRAAGARRRDPHPVRPLRPPGHPGPERGVITAVADLIVPGPVSGTGAASAWTARRRSSPGPPPARGDHRRRPRRRRLRVVLAARRAGARARRRGDRRRAAGGRSPGAADLRDPGHAEDLVGAALEAFGRLDGVVLNAGASTHRGRRRGGPGRLRRRAERST